MLCQFKAYFSPHSWSLYRKQFLRKRSQLKTTPRHDPDASSDFSLMLGVMASEAASADRVFEPTRSQFSQMLPPSCRRSQHSCISTPAFVSSCVCTVLSLLSACSGKEIGGKYCYVLKYCLNRKRDEISNLNTKSSKSINRNKNQND